MASRSSGAVRRVLFQVHLWVALILFLPLVPLGLTGSALVWPEFVNRTTNPAPRVAAGDAATLAPSAYLEAASAAAPGARLQSLKLPAAPGDAVAVAVSTGRAGPAGGKVVWLDPATAAPIKTTPSTSALYVLSHDLHGSFMVAAGAGRQLVGWAGVAMLALSLTGLWLWWPRGGGFAKGLRWRRTPDTLMNLHYMSGFWISLPLAVVSLTGVLISFPQLMPGGGQAGPPPAPRPAAGAPRGPALAPEQATAVAMAAHPGARLAALTFAGAGGRGPAAGPPVWRIELKQGAETVSVRVDDASGAIVQAPAETRGPAGAASPMRMVRELHEGAGGLVWKWIVTLTGVVPLLLAITGVYYWAKLELRKARGRRERAAVAAA